jgi:hypothetical protein
VEHQQEVLDRLIATRDNLTESFKKTLEGAENDEERRQLKRLYKNHIDAARQRDQGRR